MILSMKDWGIIMDIMVVINQMIQLFLIIGLGYFMQKKKILNDELNTKLNFIVISITTPALIFSSVCTTSISEKSMVIYTLAIATAVYVALPVISFVLVKLMRIPMHQKGLYMFMTIFSNTGFMGYPIMKALFGNDAVFYTALFNILFNLEVFTLGVILINYGNDVKMKLNPKNLLSPGVVASIIAIFIYFITKIFIPTKKKRSLTLLFILVYIHKNRLNKIVVFLYQAASSENWLLYKSA